MDRAVTTVIDRDQCIGCGLCVAVCPSQTISMEGEKAVVNGDRSLNCGHCQAVCPVGAVRVGSLDPAQAGFACFTPDPRWLPFGQFDPAQLVRLMASRRSVRNYTEEPVPPEMLADLVKIAITAPSGTNAQAWSFTVLSTREKVLDLAGRVGEVMKGFNTLAEKAWLRGGLKLVGKTQLADYYRNHYESVKRGMEEWEQNGVDLLFHGAPAVIVVGSSPDASCPAEDALLASGHLLLGAHALGLGSCMIGYAANVLQRSKEITSWLGLEPDEKVYAVIGLGWPDEKYQGQAGRRTPRLRWV